MGIANVGIKPQGLPVLRNRVVYLLFLEEGIGEVLVDLGHAGI